MKRRVVRALVLFWLVWYLCGPACEMFDFWDPPREEVHDILFNAGGGVALFAAGFGLALALLFKFRKRYLRRGREAFGPYLLLALSFCTAALFTSLLTTPIHSPPVLLRI